MTDATHKRAKKDASLTMRLTRETKDALESVAHAEGRSVSQTAERWLDLAAKGQADVAGRMGGGGIAEALLAMADFATDVRREIGDPERQLEARDALLAGWSKMIGAALPFTPDTAEGVAARMARVEGKAHARLLLAAVLDAFKDGGLSEDETAWLGDEPQITNALSPLYGQRGGSVSQLLLDYQEAAGGDALSVGVQLIARLNAAPPSFDRFAPRPADVAAAIQRHLDAMSAYMAPRSQAKRKGEALAEARAGVSPAF